MQTSLNEFRQWTLNVAMDITDYAGHFVLHSSALNLPDGDSSGITHHVLFCIHFGKNRGITTYIVHKSGKK